MATIGPVAIMHILDTDHLSLIRRNGLDGQRILANLDAHEDIEVATTVITFEEQSRGRLALLGRAKTLDQTVLAYDSLRQLASDYQSIHHDSCIRSRRRLRTSAVAKALSPTGHYGLENRGNCLDPECNAAYQKLQGLWPN